MKKTHQEAYQDKIKSILQAKGVAPKITKDMIEDWVGSDNLDPDSFLDLLVDLINEKYTIENFKTDVTEYAEEYTDRTGRVR